jgi:hypothetical protein
MAHLSLLHKTPYNLSNREQAVELSKGLPERSLYEIDVYIRDQPVRLLSKIIKPDDLNDAVEVLLRLDIDDLVRTAHRYPHNG